MEEDSLNRPCGALVIGGSAGSLQVLFQLLPILKPALTFPVILVLHRRNSSDSTLSEVLSSKNQNPIKEVEDKDPVLPGNVYLAPADYHLLIERDFTFSLDYSEKVNFSRPSIDVTFESVAEVYGRLGVALLLSGANEDGTKGFLSIKSSGGRTIAQDPETAQMPFMPHHAITHSSVDYILNIAQMADLINRM